MAKIQKKVQVIADQLQKGEKDKPVPAAPADPEVYTISPLPKGPTGLSKSKGKKSKKKIKKENLDGSKKDNQGERDIPKKDEEGLTGYAGLARRIARGFKRATEDIKFPFDD